MFLRKNRVGRLSFSLRLALIYTSALCISLAAVFSVTYQLVRRVTLNRDHDVIRAQTRQYKSIFERGGVSAIASYFSQQIEATVGQMFVRVIDEQDRVHFITVSHPFWNLLDQKTNLWHQGSFDSAQWDELFRDETKGSWVVGTTPLQPGLFLQVGRSNTESRLVLRHFKTTAFQVVFPVLLLSLLVGWVMTRGAIAPLRSLIETIRRILATGDMKQRVPAHAQHGELGELTTQFNRLLDQNEKVIRDSRETLDNVAHDLRTPMTHLRNATEHALLNPDSDREVLRNALADCAEESDQILQIFNLLMDLAEAEAGHLNLNMESISLFDLAEEVVELYAFVAEEREIVIQNDVPVYREAFADRLRLRQCLANLVDNALKYSPRGSVVTLSSEVRDGSVELNVIDQGVGMTPEELPRIWDRLYRCEHSRSTSGLGLGLSLVQAVISAHGGTVSVETALNTGSTFTLRIPQSRV